MATYYLAVDIGASSGRHILGHMENGKMILEEIYRFENGMVKKDGELCWEFDRLFNEIVNGLKKCKEIGKIPVSMGVDTWGVDFVLLDKDDKVLGNTVGYRDHRTEGMDEEVYKTISLKDLYARTGIQKAIYNTVYQLSIWSRLRHFFMYRTTFIFFLQAKKLASTQRQPQDSLYARQPRTGIMS